MMSLFQAIISEPEPPVQPADWGNTLKLLLMLAVYFIGLLVCIAACIAFTRWLKRNAKIGPAEPPPPQPPKTDVPK